MISMDLTIRELEPSALPPPDPKLTTTTLDMPISDEARRVIAAVLQQHIS